MSVSKIVAAAASGAGGDPLDIDEVFSTFLYTGNDNVLDITNNVDLTEGGLVWIKNRGYAAPHLLWSSETTGNLNSTNTDAINNTSLQPTFNNDGFTFPSSSWVSLNSSSYDYVSWTWRKAPKFFDIVKWTGTGGSRTLNHNLNSTIGMIIVKDYSNAGENWTVYHRGIDVNGDNAPETDGIYLNTTDAAGDESGFWNDTAPTSTQFTVGGNLNSSFGGGANYVAYLFAHNNNDGKFGPDSDQDIIKCGSYTGNNSTDGPTINLGFEPQWLLIRHTDANGNSWHIFDSMRGVVTGGADAFLAPNTTGDEQDTADKVEFNASGFQLKRANDDVNGSGNNYIYVAIRRGPLAAPEDATKVFDVEIGGSSVADNALATTTGFPVDMFMHFDNYSSGGEAFVVDRMRGRSAQVRTQYSNAEGTYSTNNPSLDSNSGLINRSGSTQNLSGGIYWHWKRAPSYFDVVGFSGTGSARTVAHNLGVVPEMMWVRRRNDTANWFVYHSGLTSAAYRLFLNGTNPEGSVPGAFNSTAPTASVFTVGDSGSTNASGEPHIAYLFATVAGVSKVGSYTGNGGTQNIDCGFSSGARFVLIKITSDSGDWRLYDTVRGIVAGDDSQLVLNNNSAELSSGYDLIDPHSSGFALPASPYTNNSGASYIFYAIA